MPIYAYKCESCGYARDVLQKLSDPLLTDCPECGAASFKKQLTAAGFQLKGSGWYVTDFRGGDAGASKSADAAPGASGSSDSKAAPDSSAPATAAAAPAAPPAASAVPASQSGSGTSSPKAA